MGGNASTQNVATARVFGYNPVTDTITTLTGADNWPGNNTGGIVPGGFAVVSNKLYVIGGYDLGNASTGQTWQFDPNAAVGSRWLQRNGFPVAKSYIPAAAIGGLIYTGGGTGICCQGGTIVDQADSYKSDPRARYLDGDHTHTESDRRDTGRLPSTVKCWSWVAVESRPIPRTTWTSTTPARIAGQRVPRFLRSFSRRNFPTDTDGTTRIWLVGGYDGPGVPIASDGNLRSAGGDTRAEQRCLSKGPQRSRYLRCQSASGSHQWSCRSNPALAQWRVRIRR